MSALSIAHTQAWRQTGLRAAVLLLGFRQRDWLLAVTFLEAAFYEGLQHPGR